MIPATIAELEAWMDAECMNDQSYAIGWRKIHEGYGLKKEGAELIWYYTERGGQSELKRFATETEAVHYAYTMISQDETVRRHLVGFVRAGSAELDELLSELQSRKVDFRKDMIPYNGPSDQVIRVFVFGCDVLKVEDLRDKYGFRRTQM